jgi:hypothetical protein
MFETINPKADFYQNHIQSFTIANSSDTDPDKTLELCKFDPLNTGIFNN